MWKLGKLGLSVKDKGRGAAGTLKFCQSLNYVFRSCRGTSARGRGRGPKGGSRQGIRHQKDGDLGRDAEQAGAICESEAGLGYAAIAARKRLQKRPGSAAQSVSGRRGKEVRVSSM